MNEKLGLHHILFLTNFLGYLIIAYITWDIFWIWNSGGWEGIDRFIALAVCGCVNICTVMSYLDYDKKTRSPPK